MRSLREQKLLAAFRLLDIEEQEIMVEFAETRAARREGKRPVLRLVSATTSPANIAAFCTAAGNIKDH
jgi:hypothetical protein